MILLRGGIPVGINHANLSTMWPTVDTFQTYGSSSDTWGVPLTPADVNSSNFGVQMSAATSANCSPQTCDNYAANAEVDEMRITVYHTVPGVTDTVTSPSGISVTNGSYSDANLNAFLGDFGEMLTPMTSYFPEVRPRRKDDILTPRVSARIQDDHGFLFINNHQRIRQLPEHKDFQVKLKLRSGVLQVPRAPIDVPADVYAIWPVNLDLNGVVLR